MTAIRFKTVKQVERALWRNRHRISNGFPPVLHAETADGNHGRLYFIYVHSYGPQSAQRVAIHGHTWLYQNSFSSISKWCQGGLDRSELLEWANQNLD
jgi:hypothetical protein